MAELKITRVTDFAELVSVMPLILEGYEEMNKRYKAFNLNKEQYSKEMIRITGNAPAEGIVIVRHDDEPVGYGAARDNSEYYSDTKQLLLFALYVRPKYSRKYTKPLFDYATELAKEQGYHEMVAYNGRFSGACFRLFEKVLGMRRQMTRFIISI